MTQLPAYERDPFATSLETRILRCGEEKGRPFVILEDTVCYPEGGGQPCDLGTLNGVAVLEVQKREGAIRHYLASPLAGGPASLTLDWARRFDHMQQHTGQHLLTAVAQDQFKWATTAFHLGAHVCDIELDAPSLSPARDEPDGRGGGRRKSVLGARFRPGGSAPRPTGRRRCAPGVCLRATPGLFAWCRSQGVDLNTCGGTHLHHTGEIEALKLLGTESIRGGTRLFYVAGGRVRHRLGAP